MVDLLAVNTQVFNLNSIKVHEEWLFLLWHLFDVESGRKLSKEGLSFWQGHLYLIAHIIDQLVSVLRLHL